MPLFPAPVVTAPEPRGLRYGLLTAANGPLDLPVQGRGGGVQYEPVSCGRAYIYPVECPAGVTPPAKIFDGSDDVVEADPFVVYATYTCGAAGQSAQSVEAKVRRRLANGEQSQVEKALGDILAANATSVFPPESDNLWAVVGALEQWLYGTQGVDGQGYGNVGFLHASLRTAAYAQHGGSLIKDGSVYKTPLGTIWVFGDYEDDGSVYITGNVTVWRSPDVQVPPAAQTLNRTTNQWWMLAEREYAVAYDCVAGAAVFAPEGTS